MPGQRLVSRITSSLPSDHSTYQPIGMNLPLTRLYARDSLEGSMSNVRELAKRLFLVLIIFRYGNAMRAIYSTLFFNSAVMTAFSCSLMSERSWSDARSCLVGTWLAEYSPSPARNIFNARQTMADWFRLELN